MTNISADLFLSAKANNKPDRSDILECVIGFVGSLNVESRCFVIALPVGFVPSEVGNLTAHCQQQ
jgi:hypothetical protein